MMESALTEISSSDVGVAFRRHLDETSHQTDYIFGWLLPAQWMFAIFCAVIISPQAWAGSSSSVHIHLWAALFLGGLITSLPMVLVHLLPGRISTRLVISAAQAMFSALLIHLMAGRIEAHFHVFVSLGLLAAYRDRAVLVPMIAVTTVDHLLRGFLWPMSVFGTEMLVPWRALEHAAWMIFMAGGLFYVVGQSRRQLMKKAILECSLKRERDLLESRVAARTKQLSDSRQFQESVLNSIDAQICIVNHDGEIVFVNRRWQQFIEDSGNSRSQFEVGSNYFHSCKSLEGDCRQTGAAISKAIQEIVLGKRDQFAVDYDHTSIDGIKKWFHVRLNPVVHNGETAVAIVHVDVSKLKAAQERADALATLFMESPNEVFVFSEDDLKFIEVNQGAAANLGFSVDELKTMTPLDIKKGVRREQFLQLLGNVKAAEGKAVHFECKHYRKDGSTYDATIQLSYANFRGQSVFVAFVADQTDRNQLETRLRQAQKLESMGQLAAGIAHEINTPMQCVFSNVEFLQQAFGKMVAVTDRVAELLDQSNIDWSKEREALQEIRKSSRYDYVRKQTPMALDEATEASRRVISIVRAMKVMSHPGTSQKTASDLNDLVENAATITRNRWKYVADLKLDLDKGLQQINLLPAEMSQVLINMLVNAADSIQEKLGHEPEKLGEILISTRRMGRSVQVEVTDTGLGISDELKHRIFDPFFTTKDVGKGTGQGLAITYDVVVNKHGGAIDVESTPGQGATFLLTIPLDGEGPPPLDLPLSENPTPVAN